MVIRPLQPADDRSRFHSGQPDLDRFFQRYAGQNQFRHHVGVTYVAVADAGIAGFVTVAAAHVTGTSLPRKAAVAQVPVLRLARLAVATAAQGKGVGVALVRFVLELAHGMAAQVGCTGVVVDAKADAVGFYDRLGFVPLAASEGDLADRPRTQPMWLALGAIPRPDSR